VRVRLITLLVPLFGLSRVALSGIARAGDALAGVALTGVCRTRLRSGLRVVIAGLGVVLSIRLGIRRLRLIGGVILDDKFVGLGVVGGRVRESALAILVENHACVDEKAKE
jgi:hypothetical protein